MNNRRRIIAFVFARGGSKGVPGKNIKKLGDKPLLSHSIDLAKKIEAIDEIYVSSDDSDILSVAERYGAKLIVRPQHLAQDDSSELDAWRHAIENRFEDFLFSFVVICYNVLL